MREIVRILCGSRLYGCNIPGSDWDYKIVYIPSAKRILLQRGDRLDPEEMPLIVSRLREDAKLAQSPQVEIFSLRRYLGLLCNSSNNALDMFFAPKEFYVGEPASEWYAIQGAVKHWISQNAGALYGKPSPIKEPTDLNGWKNLYHSYRVTCQAIELMETGTITFPRPERQFLKAIRLGKIPFPEVSSRIQASREQVLQAAEKSTLFADPDLVYADRIIASCYRSAVVCSGS